MGVLCLMDDALISGADQAQHDARLTEALKRGKSYSEQEQVEIQPTK